MEGKQTQNTHKHKHTSCIEVMRKTQGYEANVENINMNTLSNCETESTVCSKDAPLRDLQWLRDAQPDPTSRSYCTREDQR